MYNKEIISQLFTNFAERECKNSSELYEYLALKISKDEEILELCMTARNGQPIPNLLFGAVHYLLLKMNEHQLKNFYPSLVSNPQNPYEAFDDFKDFCLIHKEAIRHLLENKLVQTNEVRRCAYLYPVFSCINEKTKKPLALIEIGTSAGLQLLWDQYSYSYNTDEVVGNLDSKLHITSEIIGDNIPYFSKTSPFVTTRIGIDLNTIDLQNEEEYLWLKSLIWPEHKERLNMFEKAAHYLKNNSVQLIEGDGVELLNEYVNNVPMENTVCIFHTHVANQMPKETKESLLTTIEAIGKNRDVFHIYNNIQDRFLHLDSYVNGVAHKQTIAETEGHGRWFKWLIKDAIKTQ
ncbi:DUF2332 domain-containing protein [Rummeliibacillus pycnus]|uniref:DUF2332 domain-containing protein n=1 Tax=Rummeliibacillus pycnus TaxID=101070 RepID=UPI003D26B72D